MLLNKTYLLILTLHTYLSWQVNILSFPYIQVVLNLFNFLFSVEHKMKCSEECSVLTIQWKSIKSKAAFDSTDIRCMKVNLIFCSTDKRMLGLNSMKVSKRFGWFWVLVCVPILPTLSDQIRSCPWCWTSTAQTCEWEEKTQMFQKLLIQQEDFCLP